MLRVGFTRKLIQSFWCVIQFGKNVNRFLSHHIPYTVLFNVRQVFQWNNLGVRDNSFKCHSKPWLWELWDPSSYLCLIDMVSISVNDVWLSLTRSCHCVWQVIRVLVTGPIVSASPRLSPGVRSPSPWCQECRTHGLTSSTLTTHRPHSAQC